MKIRINHWLGGKLNIPDVYKDEDGHWLEIAEGDLGFKLKELANHHDIMFLGPTKESPYYRIYLDYKRKHFRAR